uniref:Uncharacterized protein n=1 Tax=Anguilla anguilla TaxID=7936 RepID=A0A0E9PBK3_ANGAN
MSGSRSVSSQSVRIWFKPFPLPLQHNTCNIMLKNRNKNKVKLE